MNCPNNQNQLRKARIVDPIFSTHVPPHPNNGLLSPELTDVITAYHNAIHRLMSAILEVRSVLYTPSLLGVVEEAQEGGGVNEALTRDKINEIM